MDFHDPNSEYLRRLVLGLARYHSHGPPITHSATRGWFWDVTPKKAVGHQARSEGKLNFPWHTDCSYETDPPQYFALHVLHADRCGGGTLSALNVSRLLENLKPGSYECLSRPEFLIQVPPEFAKGTDTITDSLITRDKDESETRIRYRADIVQPLSNEARTALTELDTLLSRGIGAEGQSLQVDLTPHTLPDNTVVLVDNGRWLHARTEVKDAKRHLRRIRWGRRTFSTEQ
ncbi:MAG: hypothetical protein Q9222_004169 [Ikaeria aurantiellina]